jgi:hypothetical protein
LQVDRAVGDAVAALAKSLRRTRRNVASVLLRDAIERYETTVLFAPVKQ